MLKLYHYWSSVCSQKVRLCLAEKGLDFESQHVNLFEFEHWDPAYVRLNPKGVVPTLVHDGRVIIESNVIIEYLEDQYPSVRLRPREPYEQALMRTWIYNSEEIAHANVNTASHNPRHAVRHKAKQHTREEMQAMAARCPNPVMAKRFLNRVEHGVPEEVENQAYAALDYLLNQMEDALATRSWLAGKEYSLADIAMAPFINRIEVLKRPEMVQAARRPRVADWWQRVRARPACEQAFSFQNPDRSDPLRR
jgi:glutathione S-transferase